MSSSRSTSDPRGRGRRAQAVLGFLTAAAASLGVAAATVAASPPPPGSWGPMAVLDDPMAQGGLDVGAGPGRIRVTERCVYLRGGGHETTLAWRSGDSSWDPTTREVVFQDDDAGEVRLSDRDRVLLGGYGGGTIEEPAGGPPMVFLVEPDPGCPATIFAVHQVRLLRDEPVASFTPIPSLSASTGPAVSPGPGRACLEAAYLGPEGPALRSDIESTAVENGWTLEQAEVRHCSSEAVGRVASTVAQEMPEVFVGSVLGDDPVAPPSLLVKGVAPPRVRELIAMEAVPIVLLDGQPYSYAELEARQARVHEALVAMGFAEVATSIAIERRGIVPAAVLRTPGRPGDAAAILAALPADLRGGVELEVYDRPRHVEDDRPDDS